MLTLVLFLLMLPNVAVAVLPSVPFSGHLWSIGVEEQFYLLWPLILKTGNALKYVLYVLAIMVIAHVICFELQQQIKNSRLLEVVAQLIDHLRFQAMAIGALALGLTIAVSALSFRYFEAPFLRLKHHHCVVRTG